MEECCLSSQRAKLANCPGGGPRVGGPLEPHQWLAHRCVPNKAAPNGWSCIAACWHLSPLIHCTSGRLLARAGGHRHTQPFGLPSGWCVGTSSGGPLGWVVTIGLHPHHALFGQSRRNWHLLSYRHKFISPCDCLGVKPLLIRLFANITIDS